MSKQLEELEELYEEACHYATPMERDGIISSLYFSLKQELEKYEQYKNIEDELGIDLVTLFKALKQGHIWVKDTELKEQIQSCCNYQLGMTGNECYFYCQYGCCDTSYDFYKIKDYGKTWALTKEELL